MMNTNKNKVNQVIKVAHISTGLETGGAEVQLLRLLTDFDKNKFEMISTSYFNINFVLYFLSPAFICNIYKPGDIEELFHFWTKLPAGFSSFNMVFINLPFIS